MTNQEILTEAIGKAIAGGWNKIDGLTFTRAWLPQDERYIKFNTIETGNIEVGGTTYSLNDIIFSHSFAKALWGEEDVTINPQLKNGNWSDITFDIPAWMHHLQQMVIADDPIQYLGDNL